MKKRRIFIGLIAFFVVIQLFRIDKTNPPIEPSLDFVKLENPPENIAVLLKNACYDCHSHSTEYPWYTNVQPFAWMIRSHFRGGRQHLNFAEWGNYDEAKKRHKLEEIAEEVESNVMPMKSYVFMHSEAKMSDAQKKELVDWVKSK